MTRTVHCSGQHRFETLSDRSGRIVECVLLASDCTLDWSEYQASALAAQDRLADSDTLLAAVVSTATLDWSEYQE